MRSPLKSIINFKGTPEYAAWFKGLAVALGLDQVGTVDEAIRRLARQKKYDPPPPRKGE